ncbi:MAG: serine/threonine protein kinase [Anaerolineae bacterium]|nr:serine/threonine protein kinase [Anaerolineae bacterium]
MATESEQVLLERYRIVSPLSRGGMGAVYNAWDLRLNVPVALKEMLPQPDMDVAMLEGLRDQFRQEAEILARLHHPNLVRVTDYFSVGALTYLVMDLVEGVSMAQLITRDGAQAEPQVLGWAAQLLDALAYCHSQGIYHRDIKPQNVIIRPDGSPILVDFGLVKFWNPDDPRTRTVVRGMATPQYAPPEQYDAGKGHTDERSDIYSLGATLYHALTGEAPPSATQRIADSGQLRAPRTVVPGVSQRTEAAILKAVELSRSARWATAQEMARGLGIDAPRSQGMTVPVPMQGVRPGRTEVLPPPAAGPRRRRRVGIWVAGAVALLLLLCAGTVWAASSFIDFPALWARTEKASDSVPKASPAVIANATETPVPTEEAVATATAVATARAVATASATPTARPTRAATATPTRAPTATATVTATPARTATPQRTATPTPEPAPTQPQLAAPLGGEHKNPVAFSWQGTLRSGQSYRVVAAHSASGTVVQGDGLSATSWATDLPADKFGEWRWRVAVVSGGNEAATSDWATFYFNPVPGAGDGGSDGPAPTNTAPAP